MDPRERMLQLLTLLQTGRAWPATDLAAALGTTDRTLRRDIGFLRGLGYPVRSAPGPGGHYRLSGGRALPPLVLDDDEAVAVALGLRLAAAGSLGVALERDAAQRSLAKLRRMLPTRLRHRVDDLLAGVDAGTTPRPLPTGESVRRLAGLVAACEVVEFEHAAKGAIRHRRVEPYRVVAVGEQWYLFGWDLDREDWRTFRLDRMSGERGSGRAFRPRELPADDVAALVQQRLRSPALRTVVLDLHLGVEEARRRLHRVDGTLESQGEDRCRYTASVDSFEWMAIVLVLSDIELTVVAPQELGVYLAAVAARLSRAVSADGVVERLL